jgi:hypothetical protein
VIPRLFPPAVNGGSSKKPGDNPEASDKKDDADSAKKGLTPEQKPAFMRELVEIGKKIGVDPAMLPK